MFRHLERCGASIRKTPMTRRSKAIRVFAKGTAILVGCAVFPTPAQTPPDQWQFSAILYGYFPTLKGSATFPSGNPANITVDPHQILNNLNIAGMGAFELRRGLGYTFSSWGEVIVAWKYLHYEFKKDNASLSMSGPAIGIGFNW